MISFPDGLLGAYMTSLKAASLIILARISVPYIFAQQEVIRPEPSKVIAAIESKSWLERSRAFEDLAGGDSRNGLSRMSQLKIMRLLETENLFLAEDAKNGGANSLGEEYSEYYASLIHLVAAMDDPASINALLGAITTGHMAMDALARFGTAAVEGVIGKLDSENGVERFAATMVLAEMLMPNNPKRIADPSGQDKVERALVRAANDRSHSVRSESIQGLSIMADLGSADALSVLRRLAQSDDYEKDGVYLVRDTARTALEKVQRRQ
jgi:hypothetical protein